MITLKEIMNVDSNVKSAKKINENYQKLRLKNVSSDDFMLVTSADIKKHTVSSLFNDITDPFAVSYKFKPTYKEIETGSIVGNVEVSLYHGHYENTIYRILLKDVFKKDFEEKDMIKTIDAHVKSFNTAIHKEFKGATFLKD